MDDAHSLSVVLYLPGPLPAPGLGGTSPTAPANSSIGDAAVKVPW